MGWAFLAVYFGPVENLQKRLSFQYGLADSSLDGAHQSPFCHIFWFESSGHMSCWTIKKTCASSRNCRVAQAALKQKVNPWPYWTAQEEHTECTSIVSPGAPPWKRHFHGLDLWVLLKTVLRFYFNYRPAFLHYWQKLRIQSRYAQLICGFVCCISM